MMADHETALARLNEELTRPPFHQVLRPRAVDVDIQKNMVTIALEYRDELARTPGEKTFHGGVIAAFADLAGHAAVAIKIGKMAPTIDLRIDYLRPVDASALTAVATLIQAGRSVARVDVEITDSRGRKIALSRGAYSTI
ncbi:MAG TPA: PaaI family thioesterase [Bryobacteraceae bacterium]|nr:PaaI family thioesterase [Bryobacteraceae bacterium]